MRDARLRYSSDREPGIRRRRSGRGFTYVGPTGRPIHGRRTLARIRRIAIPPAWRDVWICADERGHLQATGRDARGRKVYRYHERYRRRREAAKFEQLLEFGTALPRLRRRVRRDLGRPGLPRSKVVAAVIRLLEMTLMRVGNEEYARVNESFGLTTLRRDHADVRGGTVRFRFRGKSRRWHRLAVHDRRLARIVARVQDLPGQQLFEYLDEEGKPRAIGSSDVNDYLREATGRDLTSKVFRTWTATLLALRALAADDRPRADRAARREVAEAMDQVAERLGNTPAVARGSYVHPGVIEDYLAGSLPSVGRRVARRAGPSGDVVPERPTSDEEAALMRLLRKGRRGDAR